MERWFRLWNVTQCLKKKNPQASETERGNVNVYPEEKLQMRDVKDEVPEKAGLGD